MGRIKNAPTIVEFGNSLDNTSLLGQNKKRNPKDPNESSTPSKLVIQQKNAQQKFLGGYSSLTV